jgi:ligand-binding sensor domain-containing protein/signal transduction histidine kinase/DNA-binding response OmpR family regulator
MMCIVVPIRTPAQAPVLRFTHLTGEQGLSNSTIETICQDSRGFIWFGTRDGLNRYDGHEILVYRHEPGDSASLSDSYIKYIYEDGRHRLWIGTTNGLNLFNPATNKFQRFRHVDSNPRSLTDNLITSIVEDHKGRIWFGTYGGGLNLFDGSGFSHLRRLPHILCMQPDKTGRIWIGTEEGLYLLEPASGLISNFENHATTNSRGRIVTALQEDRQGNIWCGTEDDGLFLFDPRLRTFYRFAHSDKDRFSLGNNMIKCILKDQKGRLWVGSINGGLNLFNPLKNSFFHYEYETGNSASLSQRTVSSLFEDRQGNLWIGTHRGGVNIYSAGTDKFNLFRQESAPSGLGYNDIKAFCEDNGGKGEIWIGTDGGGLDLFQRDKRTFQHYRYDPFNNKSLGSNAVLDVMQDRSGKIWVSTWGGGLNLLDKQTGTFTRFQNNPTDSHSISSNFVQKTFEDYAGNIWVTTYYGGLNILDARTGRFMRGVNDPSGTTSLWGRNMVSLLEDKEGRIWIGTDDAGLNCYNQATRHFTHYFTGGDRLPDIRVLFADSKGRLWVGQKGLYLLDPSRDSFLVYTNKGGLSDEFIKGITEDFQGNLWIATSNGLTRFDPDTYAFKKYNTADGLQGLEFEANAYLKTRDGEMYFGGVNGFNSFYPAMIKANPFVPPIYITGFQLSNHKVEPGEEGSPLTTDISLTREIDLSYRQSTFSFSFAALNFTSPENNEFAYKMDGLDKDWNFLGREKRVSYTNLPPGNYTLRVKASNNDGIWNEQGASIRIHISPPFWKTSWFISLLTAICILGLYAMYRFRTRLKLKELEEKKREEMHQMQLQFFTNISHEFRTPLSLIVGPLEKLMKEHTDPALNRHFEAMHRNARRLLSLIHELMDFGKLESGSLKLNVQPGNLPSFLDEMAEEFRDWAVQKEIDFHFLQSYGQRNTWFDRQVLEKIVINLLHNAFKYTKMGGRITVEILPSLDGFRPQFSNELVLKNDFRGSTYAYIRVADTGIGISKESIHHLFERYYRITESHLGSGIGLAFVKSLVRLHKGDVYVYSERMKGTEILVGIPVAEQDYSPEETRLISSPAPGVRLEGFDQGLAELPETRGTQKADHLLMEPGPIEPVPMRFATSHAITRRDLPPVETILLVEDNAELRQFLKESLSPVYQVIEAADGKEGMIKAREASPGLIISDVIMPGMTGFELCRALKHDIDTSHIPFLMLTARSALSAQKEGLDSGADYYFAKPLNIDLLLLTIRNRFDQDRKLKDRYVRNSQMEAMELVHNEKDREFMHRLLQIIDSQLVNPDFDIEDLCARIGMSRTKLYQKIKGISQQSIGDFIRTIRLKKAVQIMTHEDVSITEVMYRVGIQTQSYFTKAFKKEFGKTPTQFMHELKKY